MVENVWLDQSQRQSRNAQMSPTTRANFPISTLRQQLPTQGSTDPPGIHLSIFSQKHTKKTKHKYKNTNARSTLTGLHRPLGEGLEGCKGAVLRRFPWFCSDLLYTSLTIHKRMLKAGLEVSSSRNWMGVSMRTFGSKWKGFPSRVVNFSGNPWKCVQMELWGKVKVLRSISEHGCNIHMLVFFCRICTLFRMEHSGWVGEGGH